MGGGVTPAVPPHHRTYGSVSRRLEQSDGVQAWPSSPHLWQVSCLLCSQSLTRSSSCALTGSARYPTGQAPASQPSGLRLSYSSTPQGICLTSPSGLQCVAAPTIPSADFSRTLPPLLKGGSHHWQHARSPRVMRTPLPIHPRHIYNNTLRVSMGLRR